MPTVTICVPPDLTPEQEQDLVAQVAESYRQAVGCERVEVLVERLEAATLALSEIARTTRWS
jgi:phenylpyruvate tautomerase PptA (4-oxalocrotonate tautomerase family)